MILKCFFSFTVAEGGGLPNGRRGRPKGGAEGAASLEGEGNPVEGGCFASVLLHAATYTPMFNSSFKHALLDLAPNGIPLGAKSIGNLYKKKKLGLRRPRWRLKKKGAPAAPQMVLKT